HPALFMLNRFTRGSADPGGVILLAGQEPLEPRLVEPLDPELHEPDIVLQVSLQLLDLREASLQPLAVRETHIGTLQPGLDVLPHLGQLVTALRGLHRWASLSGEG